MPPDSAVFRLSNILEFAAVTIVKLLGAGENSRTMPNNDVVMVILAAGKGTPVKIFSRKSSAIPPRGVPLIEARSALLWPCEPKRVVTIVGHQAEQV